MSSFFYQVGDDKLEGPYPTVAAIRSHVLKNSAEIFNSSCSCLKLGDKTNWFETVKVFQLVHVLQPTVTAKIKLEEVQP